MTSEQARGEPVDARTDLFSFGTVLYEMATGRLPFHGDSNAEILGSLLRDQPKLTTTSPELERIILKALEKDRDVRYQSALDMRADLKRLARDSSTAQPMASVPEKKTRAPAWRYGAAAALVLVLAAGSFLAWRKLHAPPLTARDVIVLSEFTNTTGDSVFDDMLKRALTIQLEESPYLSILSEERVQRALAYMGKPPTERVTRDIARVICERESVKAMVAGSIGALGSHYSIALDAVNCASGDALAHEQVDSENKETVLGALGKAARGLRARLGESLSTIQGRAGPAREQPTTTSLEAFRQFALGDAARDSGRIAEAKTFYQRAIELDPNLAMAYARVSVIQSNDLEFELARQYITKAYELRDRVSERERLYITSHYYEYATGETAKNIATLEQYRMAFPREWTPVNNLSAQLDRLGEYEKALALAQEANRMEPKAVLPYDNMSVSYWRQNKFDESKAILEQAIRNHVDTSTTHTWLSVVAYMREDPAEAARQQAWVQARSNQPARTIAESIWHEHHGRLHKADELLAIDAAVAKQRRQPATEAMSTFRSVYRDSLLGNCRDTRAAATKTLAIARDPNILSLTGVTLALCGDPARAELLAQEAVKMYPEGTIVNNVQVPVVRAAVALKTNQPQKAIEALQPALPFDRAQFLSGYLRALAYLQSKSAEKAAAEFQKILDHRGAYWFEGAPWSAAHVGLARSYVLANDSMRARREYEEFFALWKDADPDVPLLVQARKEYATLH